MSNKFVVVDLETTGNAPKKGDRIIQFAAVVIENGRIVDGYSSLVNPFKPIPLFIEELTGLNDEMVKDAPAFSEIAPTILALLEESYFVAHNVLFDLSFLQEELIEAGFEGFFGPVLDTVELSRFLLPTSDSFKLTELASFHGLKHERPHQADSDAYVTAELLLILLNQLKSLPYVTLNQLIEHAGGLKSDISLLLDEYILSESSNKEVNRDLEIFRGIALKKKKMINKSHQVQTDYPFEITEKTRLLQNAFENFEERNEQFQMMDSVYEAFTESKHVLIEAGTGVGKSLGYLLPAIIRAKETHEKVIISTYTTQLQEQLLLKDIPLLKKIFSAPFHAVLIKGRHHYLSIRKFVESLQEEDDNYDTSLTKMQILVWLTQTETGDFEELNLSSGGRIFWNKVKTDQFFHSEDRHWLSYDYYHHTKQRLKDADIIITNHSLLTADLVSSQSILPDFKYIIIDEAHHFEKTVGKSLTFSLDFLQLRLLLNHFGTLEQRQLFYKLEKVVSELDVDMNTSVHSFEVNLIVGELQIELDEMFRAVTSFTKGAKKNSHVLLSKRVSDNKSPEWKNVTVTAERLLFLLKDLVQYISGCLDGIYRKKEPMPTSLQSMTNEIKSYVDDLEKVMQKIRNIFIHPLKDYVTWIEMDPRSIQNLTTIYSQPVDISGFLLEEVFSAKSSVVLTSATMTVNKSFEFMINELGIPKDRCTTLQISSPFSFEKQVQLLVPNDLPEVNKVPLSDYVSAITEHIISIAEATRGRMLILFTSYEMLKKTYDLIKESGLLDDYVLFAQGISGGSRTRLTRNFQRFEKAILFGTSSYWEGIDIPGEALSCLVIVRLPFSPPDDPMIEAKCERLQQVGRNPFSHHSLPEAVLRFKQGFGRLIRRQTDRGLVIIFDKRILSASYGKAFLSSIPIVPVKTMGINEMLDLIDDWL